MSLSTNIGTRSSDFGARGSEIGVRKPENRARKPENGKRSAENGKRSSVSRWASVVGRASTRPNPDQALRRKAQSKLVPASQPACGRRAAAPGPAWEGARNLSTETLRQRLAEARLTTSGTRQTLIHRLCNHSTQQQQHENQSAPTSSDEEVPQETPTPNKGGLKTLTPQQRDEVMELIKKTGPQSTRQIATTR